MYNTHKIAEIRDNIENHPEKLTTEDVNEFLAFQVEIAVSDAMNSKSVKLEEKKLELMGELARLEAQTAQANLSALALEALEKKKRADDGQ